MDGKTQIIIEVVGSLGLFATSMFALVRFIITKMERIMTANNTQFFKYVETKDEQNAIIAKKFAESNEKIADRFADTIEKKQDVMVQMAEGMRTLNDGQNRSNDLHEKSTAALERNGQVLERAMMVIELHAKKDVIQAVTDAKIEDRKSTS